jgi:hypothetical protein
MFDGQVQGIDCITINLNQAWNNYQLTLTALGGINREKQVSMKDVASNLNIYQNNRTKRKWRSTVNGLKTGLWSKLDSEISLKNSCHQ